MYDIINKLFKLNMYAPVAQLDRVFGYEPNGRGFESLSARHNWTLILIKSQCLFFAQHRLLNLISKNNADFHMPITLLVISKNTLVSYLPNTEKRCSNVILLHLFFYFKTKLFSPGKISYSTPLIIRVYAPFDVIQHFSPSVSISVITSPK